MSDIPLFTVFTATYNRAHTIPRVFESLCAQTFRDFEWLVIDDGSTDETSTLIAKWAKVADFPIRYLQQQHSGKHIAHNLAVREARGQLFAPLDSDDALLPDSLERLAKSWNSIPVSERHNFSGVGGLCCDQHGAIIGDQYPASPFDANWRDVIYVRRVTGEKWIATKTEILRRFPFPEIQGTQFIPEGRVWLEIGKRYKARFINEVVRVYFTNDHKTGAQLSKRKSLGENAPGRMHYYIWLLNNDLDYFFYLPTPFLKAAVMLPIMAWSSGRSLRETSQALKSYFAKMLVWLALPFASLLYAQDKLRAHVKRGSAP
jgi:glycosyltransferase involved in cell wall biosynthesis